MLKHKTKFTALLLAAGTCFSGTICTFAESTSSADAANATARRRHCDTQYLSGL